MTKNISWSEFFIRQKFGYMEYFVYFCNSKPNNIWLDRTKNKRIEIRFFVADRAFGVSLVLIINQDLIFIINK